MKITSDLSKEQDNYILSHNNLWLTENTLGDKLSILFKNATIQHNKAISINGKKYIPDYMIEYNHKKIIVEFDGFQHYTNGIQVYKDICRKITFNNNDYIFISIPYYYQLTSAIIKYLFKNILDNYDNNDLSDGFPCGFIHPKATLPCMYCNSGLERFTRELKDLTENGLRQEINDIYTSISSRATLLNIPSDIIYKIE